VSRNSIPSPTVVSQQTQIESPHLATTLLSRVSSAGNDARAGTSGSEISWPGLIGCDQLNVLESNTARFDQQSAYTHENSPNRTISAVSLQTISSAGYEEATFDCPVDGCKKSYIRKGGLTHHLKNHSSQCFFCSVDGCKKSYNKKDELTRHLENHSGQRFLCSVNGCKKSFIKKGELTRHLKNHLGPHFFCRQDLCPRGILGNGFPRRDKLVDHLVSKHKFGRKRANYDAVLLSSWTNSV
jgi:uncharacterized Zn-finger protein